VTVLNPGAAGTGSLPVAVAGNGNAVGAIGAAKAAGQPMTRAAGLDAQLPNTPQRGQAVTAGYRTNNAASAQLLEQARDSVFKQILLKLNDDGGEMRMRTGRFGPFFACGSPKCKAAANLRGDAKKQAEAESPEANAKPIETDQVCPDCGKPMLLRLGNRGRFLACSGYPECKKTMEPPAGLLREVAAAGAAG